MENKKVALVTGSRGMDASNLIKFLLNKNYTVIGTDRYSSSPDFWRHEELGIKGKFTHVIMDITDFSNVSNVVKTYQPDEIYNLCAMSFVAESFNTPLSTFQINTNGHLNLLEAVRQFSPQSKIYFASTSEIFGKVQEVPQRETTPFYPRSPYAVAKLSSFWLTKNYREAYGIFSCSGVLFNHSGILRGESFVTRKITKNIAKVLTGKIDFFELGNINSKRDWGSSEDYIEAMWLMLQRETPEDYVISSGETRTIREFIQECFDVLNIKIEFKGEGLNEEVYIVGSKTPIIKISAKYFRPAEVDLLIGDCSKAEKELGWKRKISFKELVKSMMLFDAKKEGYIV